MMTSEEPSIGEPRGHDAIVGALLVEPDDASSETGVIFFNNVGTLHMCVHGTIGVIATLEHLGRITRGLHRLDTPRSARSPRISVRIH